MINTKGMERTYEMMRLTRIQSNMINRATTVELTKITKLSIKLIENEKWTRWGKENEEFLKKMESKYC